MYVCWYLRLNTGRCGLVVHLARWTLNDERAVIYPTLDELAGVLWVGEVQGLQGGVLTRVVG